jgi:Uncharacterized MobA-related protein
MGASLAAGIEASDDAEGWIVALADMPRIATPTIEEVARGLDGGASIVAPFYQGSAAIRSASASSIGTH